MYSRASDAHASTPGSPSSPLSRVTTLHLDTDSHQIKSGAGKSTPSPYTPSPEGNDNEEQSPEPTIDEARHPSASGPEQRRQRGETLEELGRRLNLSLTLENSGSVARDHLASERTFLAYVRTSLTIASMGVALVQLFTIAGGTNQQLQRYSRPLGATIIVIGLCTLFLGVIRYYAVQNALVKGVYPVARVSAVFVAFALCGIITAVFGILVGNKS
ncbi:hypothetical protein WOLCODRAFT_136834 [Wolfiporia cocos MD-104 SS10]|uniref:DUF202 domain-containing protein n=1 Tax=Wolfiporia cocos (strain MD-104) TaxID=742152 RepID=A0A2H3JDR6_WOLCO|nr:hypothetical protein WOLCODRAFT_136834 [Wolfiporia cocos MD-104 SS10]